MNEPFLSVIIPVYNTEKYLDQCLKSVISQSFEDMEIICIDDGSTDGSSQILNVYASCDLRIKIIHKPNGGLVSVRKLGVSEAKGKYIGFVDSDDWIDPEMYACLCSAAEKYDADMVSSSYWQEGAYSNISRDAVRAGVYEGAGMDDLRDHAILDVEKHDKGLSGSLCTKLFRTSLLKEIMPRIPSDIKVSEDKVTSLTFLLECKRAVILDGAYYHYRINQASMFHADDPDYLQNYNTVYKYFRSLYGHRNFTDKMRTQAELYIVQFLIKGINTQLGFSFRNLMWIDPDWIEEPGLGERIAIYGRGELGKTYEKHIAASNKKCFSGYVDDADVSHGEDQADSQHDYDSIVIAIKNEEAAMKAKEKLIGTGIDSEKIFWFKHEEIFWKYADAMGIGKERTDNG
ncbi:glycosyl transferase [Lachnospiraceae bacterium JC7]|nr:glycosyl transferase [Lachnospiraceae bacterium JC7]